MFKRPIPRSRGVAVSDGTTKVVYSGRVSEILDKMHKGVSNRTERPWAPPTEYKLIASQLPNPEEYIKKCEDWFAAHPPKPYITTSASSVINTEPITDLFSKYQGSVPPIPELVSAWQAAGYSDERISKAKAHREKMEASIEEREKVLDLIFAKFPSASKPTPKLKTKVIKVVKKKMPQKDNEQALG